MAFNFCEAYKYTEPKLSCFFLLSELSGFFRNSCPKMPDKIFGEYSDKNEKTLKRIT